MWVQGPTDLTHPPQPSHTLFQGIGRKVGAGTHGLGSSSTAFPHTIPGSRTGSGTAGIGTGTRMGCSHHRQQFYILKDLFSKDLFISNSKRKNYGERDLR